MKNVKIAFVALLGMSMLVSCKKENKEGEVAATVEVANEMTESTPSMPSTEVAGTIEKATFQIEGMTCALGCAKMIEGKLAALDGVTEASVDFDNKTATVAFDDAKQNVGSITEVVQKLAKGAYTVDNFKVTEISSVK